MAMGNPIQEQDPFKKIGSLSDERAAEVTDSAEFLRYQEDSRLFQTASRLSQDPLRKIWDNADDADYDLL
jgi:uncharacterized protein with ATP-grasp and redox domains